MNTEDPIEFELEEHLELEDLLELVTDWIWMMDTDGVHIYSNQAVEELLGYKREEIIGRSGWEFWPDEDKEKITKSEFQNDLKDGEGWTKFPGKFKHKDGSTKLLESSAVPIYDKEGSLVGYLGIDRDVTQKRRIRKRDKFLHSLLRHDLKNKIQIVEGYLQLLQEEDMSDESDKFLQKAIDSVEGQKNLIDKISKLREIEEEDEIGEMDLGSVMDKVLSEHKDQLQERGINLDFSEYDCKVKGGSLLEEMFSNLVENSIQHSDCEKIKIHSQKRDGECVVIVEDDGTGISDEKKDKIFDKGFKEGESAGTGLGLYMVKEIADSYGGSVEVKDSEMGGARFEIHLEKSEKFE